MQTSEASILTGTIWRNNRLVQGLTALLVVQLILVGVMYFPKGQTTTGGAPLLGDLSASAITAITVTNEKGETISLEKQGDTWVLPNADNYPADATRVGKLLDNLTGINTDRLITKTANSHKRLEVAADKFQRKVTLQTANGTQTVFIGGSSGAKATHVRLDGQAETFITDKLSSWNVPANASGWIQPDFYKVNKDDITAVTIDNASGTLNFSKDGDGNWTLDGLGADEEPDTTKINGMLNNASKINISAPIGKTADPALGLDTPSATVTVTVQPESGAAETITLVFGAKNSNGQYALQTSTSDYLAWVSSFVGDTFATKTRADFIKQPPTPTPDAAGSSN